MYFEATYFKAQLFTEITSIKREKMKTLAFEQLLPLEMRNRVKETIQIVREKMGEKMCEGMTGGANGTNGTR